MKNKKIRSILQTAAMLIAAAFIGGVFALSLQPGAENAGVDDESTPRIQEHAPDQNDEGIAASRRILPSVVGIRCSGTEENLNAAFESTGSGVILDERGYIITNHHVIESSEKISVIFSDDSEADATLIGSDVRTDLALLKTEKTGLIAASFNEEKVSVGTTVYAVGDPAGSDFAGTVTRGIVSGIDRTLITDDGASFPLIQTDAAINPGNSGGPLCNESGEVIAINTIKISEIGFEGMGFAIPVPIVKEIAAELLDHGEIRRGALGVYLAATVDKSFAAEYNTGIDYGVVIIPQEGSAAEKAGLKAFDIITAINGEIVRDIASLQQKIFSLHIGDSVIVRIRRDNAMKEYPVILEELNDQ